MNGLTQYWIVFVLAGGFGYTAVAQSEPRVPAVDVYTPNQALNLKADDVCTIDYRNVRVFGENSEWSARLKNGRYERKSDSGYESARLDHVFCFSDKDGEHRALVMTKWLDCGGSCTSIGVVQLFELRVRQPVITEQFVYDSHAKGTHATFDEKSLTLTITARSDDGSPNCCAKNFDVVEYRWQGTKFQQRGYKRVPASPTPNMGEDKPLPLR